MYGNIHVCTHVLHAIRVYTHVYFIYNICIYMISIHVCTHVLHAIRVYIHVYFIYNICIYMIEYIHLYIEYSIYTSIKTQSTFYIDICTQCMHTHMYVCIHIYIYTLDNH